MNAIVVILASSFFSHTLQMHQDNAGHWSPALVDAANYVAKAIGKVMCSLQMQQRTHMTPFLIARTASYFPEVSPKIPFYHSNLGEIFRRQKRFQVGIP